MAIKNDILKLVAEQEKLKKEKGRYVQGLKTIGTEKALIKPKDEKEVVLLDAGASDYKFRVDVWSGPDGDGFSVTAEKDLGDAVLETVTYRMGEFI